MAYNFRFPKKAVNTKYVSDIPIVPVRNDWRSLFDLVLVESIDQLKSIRDEFRLLGCPPMATDTENTSLSFIQADLVGFSFCFQNRVAYYVPVGHQLGVNLPLDEAVAIWKEMCEEAELVLYFNYRYDMRIQRKYGFDPWKVKHFNVQSLIWNLDTNLRMPSLKDSALNYLGIVMTTFEDLVGELENISFLSADNVADYAAADALATFLLYVRFKDFLENNQFINFLDNELERVLMFLEEVDVRLNMETIRALQQVKLGEIENKAAEIYEECRREFNIKSPEQVTEVLLNMGVPLTKKTKTGFSTDVKALTPFKHRYPVVQKILDYKSLRTIMDSYITPFLKYFEEYGSEICHVKYNTTVAPTGRLSGGKDKKEIKDGFFLPVNIHSMPKPSPAYYLPKRSSDPANILGWIFIPCDKKTPGAVEGKEAMSNRKVFQPEEGYYVLSIDYDSEELVIAANLSDDMVWLEPMIKGEDSHKAVAIAMVGAENYNEEVRKVAKTINYGGLYYGNEYTFKAKLPDKSIEELRLYYDKWCRAHKAYWDYMKKCNMLASKTGFIKTQLGRIRRVGHYYRTNPEFADKTVANTQIQGLAADIIRLVLINLYRKVFTNPIYYDKIKFMATMHDEVDFSITKNRDDFTKSALAVSAVMNDLPFNWKKPLTTSLSVGNDWGSIFPFEYINEEWVPVPTREGEQRYFA